MYGLSRRLWETKSVGNFDFDLSRSFKVKPGGANGLIYMVPPACLIVTYVLRRLIYDKASKSE